MTTITITTFAGPHTLQAHVFGQWAAHPSHDGPGWRVTHVPSGLGTQQIADNLHEVTALTIAESLSRHLPNLLFRERLAEIDVATLRQVFAEVVR